MTMIHEEDMIEGVKCPTKRSNGETDNIRKNTEHGIVPPDGGYGWVIVFAGSICAFIVYGIVYSFGIFLVYFVDYYGTSKAEAAWIGSSFSGCLFLIGPVSGALVNRFGPRGVVLFGSFISASAFLLSIAAPNIKILTFTYGILGGIGFGHINVALLVCVSYYFSSRRGFATGLLMCSGSLGNFSIPPLINLLLKVYDLKGTLIILSGLVLNCMVFGSLMRPLSLNCGNKKPRAHYNNQNAKTEENLLCNLNSKKSRVTRNAKEVCNETTETTIVSDDTFSSFQLQSNIKPETSKYVKLCKGMVHTMAKTLDLALLKETKFFIIGIAYLLGMMGFFIPFVFLPHMSITKGIDREKSPYLISILAISNLLGRLVLGYITDRPKVRALDLTIVCLCISALASFIFPFCYSFQAIASVSVIYGFFISPQICLLNIILVDMLGLKKLANAFGLVSLFRGIGYLIGSPIAGAIFDATGSYDISFYMSGIFLLLSASSMMIVMAMTRRRKK